MKLYIYIGGILPLMLYRTPAWKSMFKRHCYKAKLIRIQKVINLKVAKAYRTVSNEALCIINGITPINIKIEEIGKLYEITKGGGTQHTHTCTCARAHTHTHTHTHTLSLVSSEDEKFFRQKLQTKLKHPFHVQ